MAFKLLMSVCCEYPHENPAVLPIMQGEKMKEAKNFDLKMLEQMSESDPPSLLRIYAEVYDSADASERNSLDYFYARALVSMNQLEQAEAKALDLLSNALDEANYQQISRANLILSRCYADSVDKSREKPYLDNAWEAARKAKDDTLIVSCMMLLGSFYQRQGDSSKALDFYARASRHIDPETDPLSQAKLKLAVGTIHYQAEEYNKAMPHLLVALESSIKARDLGLQLLIINNLSTLYSVMQRFRDAEDVLLKGLETAKSNKLMMHVIRFTFNLGTLFLRQKRFEEAQGYFLECSSLATSIGFADPQFVCDLNNNLAGCYRQLGNIGKAIELIDEAEATARNVLGPDKVKELEINKANLLLDTGQLKEGRELLRSIRKHFLTHKTLSQLTMVQAILAESYASEGKYDLALKYYRELDNTYKDYIGQVLSERSPGMEKPVDEIVPAMEQSQHNADTDRRITERIPDFVGVSRGFKRALEAGLLAAQHPNASVFITGESGTGKDVLANIIHRHSVRRAFPFVAVNVSAVTSGLLESEFFGHKKGAFTSAVNDHNGYFIQANRGTLFLDEIGDMPIELQAKLLRALENRRIIPVGAQKELNFDCRIISSTNREINDLMKRNLFRLDLLHRLNTIEIHIPPLRERPEDIEVLLEHYLVCIARETNRRVPKLDSSLIDTIKSFPFPGNVRELRNLIERLFIFNSEDKWDLRVLDTVIASPKSSDQAMSVLQPEDDRESIINALVESGGKQKDAARLLGMSESTLTRKIAKLRLQVYTRKGG